MNTIERERFLEKRGWERYGKTHWVKTEWLNEPETLKLEPHLCPNWYHIESFDSAYEMEIVEVTEKTTKEDYAIETSMRLERILLDAMNGSNWSDVRSAVRGFAKKTLYQWYLSECQGKPNPFIVKDFENK